MKRTRAFPRFAALFALTVGACGTVRGASPEAAIGPSKTENDDGSVEPERDASHIGAAVPLPSFGRTEPSITRLPLWPDVVAASPWGPPADCSLRPHEVLGSVEGRDWRGRGETRTYPLPSKALENVDGSQSWKYPAGPPGPEEYERHLCAAASTPPKGTKKGITAVRGLPKECCSGGPY